MKKTIIFTLALAAPALFFSLDAAPNTQSIHTNKNSLETDEKYKILKRDEVDDTDALAIPFDDSEIEDEEQIDLDEKKQVFDLPQQR